MKSRSSQFQTTGALEWIEQATHLLRTSPLSVLGLYYIGALPFVLGFLFFWTDMSQSPFARQHVVEAAFGVAFLFLWMKTWQAFFCVRLRAVIAGEQPEPLTWRRVVRVSVAQATIQPSGLLLIPIASVLTLPFAWVYGFYQNVTVLADGEGPAGGSLAKRAGKLAGLWPRPYHVVLLVLMGFGFFVFLNCVVVCLTLPGLLKTLLGIETTFSRSPFSMLNTTFFATMAGLTYLCVDPIVKAIHVLRCFRGEAVTTGDDLKSELRQIVRAVRPVALLVALAVLCLGGGMARAAEPAAAAPRSAVPQAEAASLPARQLDQTIDEVIHEDKYTWRMPREKVGKGEEAKQGIVARFFQLIGEKLRKRAKATVEWLGEWLRELMSRRRSGSSGSGYGWMVGSQMLLYVLIILVVAALLYLAYRLWRGWRNEPKIVEAEGIQPVPDLTDENVGADQLPEDAWTKMARELLARGEFRLAMRAFYLASLAHLAGRNLITLAKFKSNRDYERELARRGHVLVELLSAFAENVSTFDCVWYGMHAVDDEAVSRFAANVDKIRTATA